MSSLNPCTDEAESLPSGPSPGVSQPRFCSKNDEIRFAAVVLPYLADAYALARWLTNNQADSQDVVQHACLRALHGIGNFAGGDARSWVLTIVRRAAYDWLHRNRPAALVATEDGGHPEGSQLGDPGAGTAENWLIEREDKALFESAFAALPAPYRQTIALRHLQGLTYSEIAETIGISIGTVMSRLSRARRHLIERMNPTRLSSPPRDRNGTVGTRSTRFNSNSLSPSFKHSIGHAGNGRASSAPRSLSDQLQTCSDCRRGV
jgi:RNA polymerase sigma factor (sigma-70 family)